MIVLNLVLGYRCTNALFGTSHGTINSTDGEFKVIVNLAAGTASHTASGIRLPTKSY